MVGARIIGVYAVAVIIAAALAIFLKRRKAYSF